MFKLKIVILFFVLLFPAIAFSACPNAYKDCRCTLAVNNGFGSVPDVDVVYCCKYGCGAMGFNGDSRCCIGAEQGKTWNGSACVAACTLGSWTASASNGTTTCGTTPTAGCVQYAACGTNGAPACAAAASVSATEVCGGGWGHEQCGYRNLGSHCSFQGWVGGTPSCSSPDAAASCSGKASGYVCLYSAANSLCDKDTYGEKWIYDGTSVCSSGYEQDSLSMGCYDMPRSATKVTCNSPYYKRTCN